MADTIVPEAKNPQALNRYTYTLNNPMKYLDPSGHDPLDATWENAFKNAHRDAQGNPIAPTDEDKIDRLNSYIASAISGKPWTDADWQRYTRWKEAGIVDPGDVLQGTSGTMSERIQQASALAALAGSGPAGLGIYYSFIHQSRGTVQFGGGEFIVVPFTGWIIGRQPGYSIGWDNRVYLEPALMEQPAEIIAANIAHEAYHAQQRVPRDPFTRREEVGAFIQEARAWEGLRVTHAGSGGAPYDAIVDAYRSGTLDMFVSLPGTIYTSWVYRP